MPIPNLRYFTSLQLAQLSRAASARKAAIRADPFGMSSEDEAEWTFLDTFQKDLRLMLLEFHHLSEVTLAILLDPPPKTLIAPPMFDEDD